MLKARRAFLLTFGFGILACFAAGVYTASQIRSREGTQEVVTAFFGIVLFRAERTITPAESSVSLKPGLGALILLVVLPSVIAGAVFLRDRASRSEHGADAVRS